MKKTKKMVASILLAGSMLFACACDPKEEVDLKLSQAPDYSKYTHKFDPYAYASMFDGKYSIDEEVFDVGEDFRTLERLQEYRDAGLTTLMPQRSIDLYVDITAENWPEREVYMDYAQQAGLKVLLMDGRLRSLSKMKNLIGEDTAEIDYYYSSQEELDAYVMECVQYYKDHPAFYGLVLADEPTYDMAESYGIMYKTIRRLLPDCYIQWNLFPVNTSLDVTNRFPPLDYEFEGTEEERKYEEYRAYLELFLDATGMEHLCYDDYPIGPNGIDSVYLRGLQIASEVCKERGIDLHLVAQTFGMYQNGQLRYPIVTKEDLYWQNNVLLGFGVKEIHYYTYWTGAENETSGEMRIDGGSWLTYAGEKTYIYDTMKEILAQNQQFANVIKQFNYQGVRYYVKLPCIFNISHLYDLDNSYTLKKVTDVSIDKEAALVTELYDSENDNYLYMVMNVLSGNDKGSVAYQTNTITFSNEYTHVVVYKDGVGTPQKLEEGNKLTVELEAGQAVYLLPY